MMYHHFMRALLAAIVFWTGSIEAQQPKNSESSKWQAKTQFPAVVVAKFDEKKPNVLSVLVPSIKYRLVERSYESNTADAAQASTGPAQETGAPNSTKKQYRTINDLLESFGPMELKQLPLEDIEFFTLDDVPILQNNALALLKNPTHIFYEYGPDEYHRSVTRQDIMVVKIKKEKANDKFLPLGSEKFPD